MTIVSAWLAWIVFHQIMANPGAASDAISAQLHFTAAERAAVVAAGQAYLADIQKINDDAQVEIARRYKYTPEQTGPPKPGEPHKRPAHEQLPVRVRAQADGYLPQIEGKKNAAYQSHLPAIKKALGNDKLDSVQDFIQRTIVPTIQPDFTFDPLHPGPAQTPKGPVPTPPATPRGPGGVE